MFPIATELTYVANDAAYTAIPLLENLLTNLATESEWPEHLIKAMSVQYDGENLILSYPPELAEEINDLEYGTLNKLPNAVIRPFLSRSSDIIQNVLVTNSFDDIMEIEGVF